MRSRALIPLAIFLLAGAAARADDAETAARTGIRDAHDRMARAEIRGDRRSMLDLYTEDAVLVPPGGIAVTGKDAIAGWLSREDSDSAPPTRLEFETQSLLVKGSLAVEVGQSQGERASPGGPPRPFRDAYLAVWSRDADGNWLLSRLMWSPSGAAPAPVPAPSAPTAAPSAATFVFPEPSSLPMPDPRSLSDGFVREIQDRLRSFVRRIREHPEDRDGLARAVKYLVMQIRDVGWIDIGRFGVPAACNAAEIVQKSGDRRLMETTLPWMARGLKTSEGSACYDRVVAAYGKLRD